MYFSVTRGAHPTVSDENAMPYHKQLIFSFSYFLIEFVWLFCITARLRVESISPGSPAAAAAADAKIQEGDIVARWV